MYAERFYFFTSLAVLLATIGNVPVIVQGSPLVNLFPNGDFEGVHGLDGLTNKTLLDDILHNLTSNDTGTSTGIPLSITADVDVGDKRRRNFFSGNSTDDGFLGGTVDGVLNNTLGDLGDLTDNVTSAVGDLTGNITDGVKVNVAAGDNANSDESVDF